MNQIHPIPHPQAAKQADERELWIGVRRGLKTIVLALTVAAQRNNSAGLGRVARMVDAAACVVGRDFGLSE